VPTPSADTPRRELLPVIPLSDAHTAPAHSVYG
jgi:hypothetical protein